jgi:hypothetical protein
MFLDMLLNGFCAIFVEVGRSSGYSRKKNEKNLRGILGYLVFFLGLATMVIEKSYFSIGYLE